MRKFLVLGGSGFIGRELIGKLSSEDEVIVADTVMADEFSKMSNVRFMPMDFVHTNAFEPYLDGVDTVIHLICTLFPSDGTEDLQQDIESNVLSTIRLLDCIVSKGKIKLLFLSSGGTVYGNGGNLPTRESDPQHPFCKYALIKTMIEKTIELYRNQRSLDAVIVRLSNPYGFLRNRGRTQGLIPIMIDRFLKNETLTVWGNGQNVRDYIYIDDAIAGILAILGYEGHEWEFNIGSGIGISIDELIQLIGKRLGLIQTPVEYTAARICDLDMNVLDISKLTRFTGWRPAIDIHTGIDLVIKQFRLSAPSADPKTGES